jgi:hypothetical protein
MELLYLYKKILENSDKKIDYHLDRLNYLYEMRGGINLENDLFYRDLRSSEISSLYSSKKVLDTLIKVEEQELCRIMGEIDYSKEMLKEIVKLI